MAIKLTENGKESSHVWAYYKEEIGKPKRLQEKIPWEGEFRPKKRSVSWVNSVLRQFWSHGL